MLLRRIDLLSFTNDKKDEDDDDDPVDALISKLELSVARDVNGMSEEVDSERECPEL